MVRSERIFCFSIRQAPIYNIPSEILVPVGSQSLIVDVLLIKFANAGECTSFRCEVVSRNEDKKFWIEDGKVKQE